MIEKYLQSEKNMIKPILTEKSLNLAKTGRYSFWVGKELIKTQIRKMIESLFGVHVTSIKTINYKGRTKTNLKRMKIKIAARKKAMVTLKEGEKIDLFEVKKGK